MADTELELVVVVMVVVVLARLVVPASQPASSPRVRIDFPGGASRDPVRLTD